MLARGGATVLVDSMVRDVLPLHSARDAFDAPSDLGGTGQGVVTNRDFLFAIRQALLMALDALERKLGIEPRTAEIRRLYRAS